MISSSKTIKIFISYYFQNGFESVNFYDTYFEFFLIHEWGNDACRNALNSTAIEKILKQGKEQPYDLIIVEQFNSDCMLGIAHMLKAPVIGLSSSNFMPWHYTKMGLPFEPSFEATLFSHSSNLNTFKTRLTNWFTTAYMNYFYKKVTEVNDNQLLKKRFGNDIPDVRELSNKVSMTFVNQHYSLSGSKHLSPNIIELGGIHIQDIKPLDQVIIYVIL